MFVPNAEKAIVDINKLRDYCLNPNHAVGKHKARIFAATLGLNANDAGELSLALLFAAKKFEAQTGRADKFGQRYTVDFQLERGGGKATVRSGWIIETNTDFPRLTTCFVL